MEPKKQTYTPNDKVSTNLRKYLISSLASFEKNKEWADVGHWLQKVAKLLEDYPSPYIPEKVTFAKRLAQCLNPSLPHGVHMSTLHIYSVVFKNMKEGGVSWAEDLGIYSIGIFPFFQYASFQVKPFILELYQKYYFPMRRQLIPCIPGLVVSILPGLDEQNEDLQKKVFATLDQACECTGKKYFIGALWMAILRTPKVRNAAIKYLSKRLKRLVEDDDDANIPESDHEDSPIKVKKLTQATQDAENDPDSNIPDDPSIDVKVLKKAEVILASKSDDNVVMTEGPSNTLSPQMISQLKNIENDLLSPELDDSPDLNSVEIEYPNKSSLVLNALIAGLEDDNTLVQRITLDFLHSHFKLSGGLFTVLEKCILVEAALRLLTRKDLSITRRVYTWIFGPPDLENKYQVTEKNQDVLKYFIKATTTILELTPKTSTQAILPLRVLQNFYMEHDHLVEPTLKEIIVPLLTYIQKNSSSEVNFRDEVWKIGLRFMENITSYFATILNSLSSHLDVNINSQNNEKCLEIINLIEFMFRLETSIKNKEDNQNYMEQRDYLVSIILGILRSISSISPDQILHSSFVFTAMSLTARLMETLDHVFEKLRYDKSDQLAFYKKFDEGVANFSSFFKTLVDVVINTQPDSISSRALTLINLSGLIATKLPKYQLNMEYKELPGWVKSLFSCIQSANSTIAIIGIEHLLRFVLLESQKFPEYGRIKYLIESEGTKNQSNFIQITMEKIWNLLDRHYDQTKVCELLILFHAHYSEIFSEVINLSFGVSSISEKEIAIRRFANFWKLAGEYHRNSTFLTSGIGLFSMLDSLENDNPLLRHTSKTWLSDSIPYLYRVIDPIFEVLLQMNSKRYQTEGKQYFYTKPYDTTRANDAFKKLKSILIVANELFIRYISVIKVSEKLKTLCRLNFDENLPNLDKSTYLNLLVVLCLRYIQGQVIESLSLRFQTENASVNASACEFLELLIVQIENKEQSAIVTRDIMEPLLIVMKHAIQNRDYVMQVQLINLLKVILFQSSYCRFEGTKTECVSVLSSQYFIPNLLKGLELQISYVRVQYTVLGKSLASIEFSTKLGRIQL